MPRLLLTVQGQGRLSEVPASWSAAWFAASYACLLPLGLPTFPVQCRRHGLADGDQRWRSACSACAQVAINWTLCKGAVPIPGAKNAKQAREAAGALGWRLTGDEVRAGAPAGCNAA